ncbi:MAG: ROK family protein [Rhodobacteraceae bacterium]|nr:ROK family protein [Paracoccaceae bacterium]
MVFLCCDLGGTTADWGVYDPKDDTFLFRCTMAISEFEDFYEMMDHLLANYDAQSVGKEKITNATFGIAGPTDNKMVTPTNIPGWEIRTETVNAILEDHGHEGYSSIINDFEALGYGILRLLQDGFDREKCVEIHGRLKTGPARVGVNLGTRSLICGPGTGLGVACIVDGLLKDGFPYIISSEGGHHSLAPENVAQYRFLSSGSEFKGARSYEETLSRSGLRNMYNFFRREDHAAEPNYSITSEEIIMLATTGRDQAATDAIELFCEFLANFCGNSALTFNCDKAVFLWGGVLLEMPRDLLVARFQRHYADRRNHSGRISRVPVVLLQNPDVPLLGCAHRSSFEIEFLKNE